MTHGRLRLVLSLVLGVLSCGPPPAAEDAGSPDSGPVDAGRADSGVADAGAPDAGEVDAGAPDSGVSDAGPSDAGSADAGDVDAGLTDAGASDAGTPDAGCGCGSRVCLADGGCGDCLVDTQCAPATPICDESTNTCVQCRAAPDTCDAGQYCLDGTCTAGCRTAADCSSGLCLPSHDCQTCRDDSECAAGRLCGTGTCTAPCTSGCDGGWACCNGRCVDDSRDPLHCGQCNQPCAADTFCGSSTCRAALLTNACALPVATAVLDGADDLQSTALATAVAAACSPTVVSRAASQFDAGLLDVGTGEPLVTGELLCAAGGSFRQRVIGWLEQHNLAPVRDTSVATTYQYRQRDGGIVTQGPVSSISSTHDVVVVQLAAAPSGALVLNTAGYFSEGTVAATWYFVNVLLPMRVSLTDGWYVVDWVDTNPNGQPDALDTWTLIASGR